MLIHSTLKTDRPRPLRTKKPAGASAADPQSPKDSFLSSAGSATWSAAKRVGKALKPYAKSALITAAPAAATAVAAAIGGAPAAGIAMLASAGVGMVAGAATWGKDIGILRGLAAGGMAGMLSSALGGIGGAIGVTYMATVGATREALLRFLP
jgi:hypothetical protein